MPKYRSGAWLARGNRILAAIMSEFGQSWAPMLQLLAATVGPNSGRNPTGIQVGSDRTLSSAKSRLDFGQIGARIQPIMAASAVAAGIHGWAKFRP